MFCHGDLQCMGTLDGKIEQTSCIESVPMIHSHDHAVDEEELKIEKFEKRLAESVRTQTRLGGPHMKVSQSSVNASKALYSAGILFSSLNQRPERAISTRLWPVALE